MKIMRSRRRRNIQWDTPKRMVLCCLFRLFRRDNRKWEEIFSHMFRSHLTERGITGFIPFTTLNIQWVNMREHGDPIWHRVHIATDFKKDGEWQDTISSIHSAAQALRLEIQEKDEDSVDISRWRHPGTALAARTRQLSSAAVSNDPPVSPASAPATTRLMKFAWNEIEDLETSPYFAHNEDQYDIEATDMTTDDEAEDKSEHNTPLERNQSVVTSHGKRCLWCEQEAPLADERNDGFEFVPASVHDLEDWNDIQREQSISYENQSDQEQCQPNESQPTLPEQPSKVADHFMQTLTRVPASSIFDLNIEEKDNNKEEDESASVLSALQREWPSDDYDNDHDPDTPTPHPKRDAIIWERINTPGPHECE